MTVATETRAIEYDGNDVTVDFPVPFPFQSDEQVVVTSVSVGGTETVLVLGVHYSVAGAGEATGTVTALVAPVTGAALRIERTVDYIQPLALRTQGTFSPSVHEGAWDYLTYLCQQLNTRLAAVEALEAVVTDSAALLALQEALALLQAGANYSEAIVTLGAGQDYGEVIGDSAYAEANDGGASGTVDIVIGQEANASYGGAGTLTRLVGVMVHTLTKTGAGTVTEAIGLRIAPQTVAAGNSWALKYDQAGGFGIRASGAVELGGAATYNAAAGITAYASGGQANATALTNEVAFVDTVALAGGSVKLPVATVGKRFLVFNTTSNSLNIFPASGGSINALGANNAFALAAGLSVEIWGCSTTAWRTR